MLTVHQLAKSFALNTLFENVTFSLNAGVRMALVGPNGCGKTTLLRILAGDDTADSGVVTREPGLRIGYLALGFADYAGVSGRAGFPGGALIVSHDRVFLDRTVDRVLAMDPQERRVREYAGGGIGIPRQFGAPRRRKDGS